MYRGSYLELMVLFLSFFPEREGCSPLIIPGEILRSVLQSFAGGHLEFLDWKVFFFEPAFYQFIGYLFRQCCFLFWDDLNSLCIGPLNEIDHEPRARVEKKVFAAAVSRRSERAINNSTENCSVIHMMVDQNHSSYDSENKLLLGRFSWGI